MRSISSLTRMMASLLLVVGALVSGCSKPQEHSVTSLDQAMDLVIDQIYDGQLGDRAMFASSNPKTTGSMIGTWPTPEKFIVESESWFFFIDEVPEANWEHPARFVLVDSETGEIQAIQVSTPPDDLMELMPMNPVAKVQFEILKQNLESVKDITQLGRYLFLKKEKYAVLLSGGWNAGNNHSRYWNDLSFIYEALKVKYHYTDEEIIVLFANGTHAPSEDLDGDGVDDIDYSATYDNLETVMQNVGNSLGNDGKFFWRIYT